MCEKRTKRVKKGSYITRLREARRIQRLRRLAISTPVLPRAEPVRPPCPAAAAGPIYMDKALQNRVLIELAWKTVMLMRKNKIIQQKIVDLQKETTEYVAKALSNPENRQRYLDHIRHQGILTQPQSECATLHPNE